MAEPTKPGKVDLLGITLTQTAFEAILSQLPNGTVVDFRLGHITNMTGMDMADWDHLNVTIYGSYLEVSRSMLNWTIGPGGDFPTVEAWEAAYPGATWKGRIIMESADYPDGHDHRT